MILTKRQEKDVELGRQFQNRFNKMIIGRRKDNGYLVIILRSKSDAVLNIVTTQMDPVEIEKRK